jgi:hypothetical protein
VFKVATVTRRQQRLRFELGESRAEPNDLVVPTYSVAYTKDQPTPPTLFPLAAEAIFDTDGKVFHDTLFPQQKTIDLLLAQLVG